MRVIFLDFDGVILNEATKFRTLDPGCVRLLDALCRDSGAQVVISSTWRHFGMDLCRDLLRAAGFTGTIIGATPDLPRDIRGEEIGMWLRRCGQDIERLAILDDADDMGSLLPYLVQTDGRIGLTQAGVERALTLLTAQQEQR